MQKGQAFVISNSSFLLPHGASIVLVPMSGKKVMSDLVSPVFNSSLSAGGKVSLDTLAAKGIDKLHIVSKADISPQSFTFVEAVSVCNENPDEFKTWVLFTVYKHNDSWKVRFINETLSGNDTLLKYLRIDEQIDIVSECHQVYSPSSSIRNNANELVNSKSGGHAKESASVLARSLMNEGMSLFGRLKGKASTAVSHVKNQKFLDAACAVSAIVAFADGYASPEETSKLLSFIRSHEILNVYAEAEVRSSFEKFVSQMKLDHVIGEGKAMSAISPFSGKSDAHVLVALAAGIAAAELGVDDDERQAIQRIGKTLSVDVTDILARI
jgi:tellurite resistance protein